MAKADLSRKDAAEIERDRLSLRYGLMKTGVVCAAWVSAVYLSQGIFVALAGKETILALKLAFLSDIKVAASFALTGFAGLWAFLERQLRYRKVEQMAGRIRELESRIDPNRTSSQLTTKGKTNPRDKP